VRAPCKSTKARLSVYKLQGRLRTKKVEVERCKLRFQLRVLVRQPSHDSEHISAAASTTLHHNRIVLIRLLLLLLLLLLQLVRGRRGKLAARSLELGFRREQLAPQRLVRARCVLRCCELPPQPLHLGLGGAEGLRGVGCLRLRQPRSGGASGYAAAAARLLWLLRGPAKPIDLGALLVRDAPQPRHELLELRFSPPAAVLGAPSCSSVQAGR
jgi:hypothetical protein